MMGITMSALKGAAYKIASQELEIKSLKAELTEIRKDLDLIMKKTRS